MEKTFSKEELHKKAISYLRECVAELLKRHRNVNFDKEITKNLNFKLSSVLIHYLNNEIEEDIRNKMEKCAYLEKENKRIKNEFLFVKETYEKKVFAARKEKHEAQKKFDDLEKYLQSMQKRNENNKNLQSECRSTETLLSYLSSSNISVEDAKDNSESSLKLLGLYQSFFTKKMQIFNEVREKSKNKFVEEIERINSECIDNHTDKKRILSIKEKEKKLNELEKRYSATICTLNKQLHLKLSEEPVYTSSFSKTKEIIQKSIEKKVENRKQKVFKEIKKEMPEFETSDLNDMNRALFEFTEATLLEKEANCRKKLEKSAKRQIKLRIKLAELLKEIEDIKREKQDTSVVLSEIDVLKAEWDEQRSLLDEKMMLISQQSTKSNESVFETPKK